MRWVRPIKALSAPGEPNASRPGQLRPPGAPIQPKNWGRGTTAKWLASRSGIASLILLAVILLLLGVSLLVGSGSFSAATTWAALWDYQPELSSHLVIWELRLPRTILAVLVGAMLGVSGSLMQALTRNPLAEPGTLGVSAGAASGVLLGLLATGGSNFIVYVWFAFGGAAAASVIVFVLGGAGSAGTNPVRLILAGAGLSIVLQSVNTIIILSSQDEVFLAFRAWATGNLAGRGWDLLPTVTLICLLGLVFGTALGRPLNAVALGNDTARALGVSPRVTWTLSSLAILALAGTATAAAGPIGFLGLAAPHLARTLLGPDYRLITPLAALLGAALLLFADILGRVLAGGIELGAGVMSALIGGPFFIMLVRRYRLAQL